MLGIVVSRADSASVAIGEQLQTLASWERVDDPDRSDADGGETVYRRPGIELREFDEWHLHLDRPAAAFGDLDLLVFPSRHSGETGPLLTAHHTGNFGPADHGGTDNDLAAACPNAQKTVLDSLVQYAPAEYEVGMECTHHGPSTVGAPSMFVEVGSAEPQWNDDDAARAVARAILDLEGVSPYETTEDTNPRQLVGFGGGHYVPRFERVVRETDWAVGHIAADWGLEAMPELDSEAGRDVIAQAFTQSNAAYALVDGDRPEVEAAVDACGYRAVSETWVRETEGVSLTLVDALETDLCPVADGLRFGTQARDCAEERYSLGSLPSALLDEVRGIDREVAYETLESETVAFVTDQGGTRPAGPIALQREADRESIIDAFTEILRQRYDDVERTDDSLLASQRQFDPAKAKTLGVSEGPAFGRLSNGETIEVDGRTIPPEKVRTERTERFEL